MGNGNSMRKKVVLAGLVAAILVGFLAGWPSKGCEINGDEDPGYAVAYIMTSGAIA